VNFEQWVLLFGVVMAWWHGYFVGRGTEIKKRIEERRGR
jgi:hypothetical protein